MSSTFWINKPDILIDFKQPFLPSNSLHCEQNMNAITKLVIVFSLFGLILTESLNKRSELFSVLIFSIHYILNI